jgi:hypothetical protein
MELELKVKKNQITDVNNLRRLVRYKFKSIEDAASKLGVNYANLSSALNGNLHGIAPIRKLQAYFGLSDSQVLEFWPWERVRGEETSRGDAENAEKIAELSDLRRLLKIRFGSLQSAASELEINYKNLSDTLRGRLNVISHIRKLQSYFGLSDLQVLEFWPSLRVWPRDPWERVSNGRRSQVTVAEAKNQRLKQRIDAIAGTQDGKLPATVVRKKSQEKKKKKGAKK